MRLVPRSGTAVPPPCPDRAHKAAPCGSASIKGLRPWVPGTLLSSTQPTGPAASGILGLDTPLSQGPPAVSAPTPPHPTRPPPGRKVLRPSDIFDTITEEEAAREALRAQRVAARRAGLAAAASASAAAQASLASALNAEYGAKVRGWGGLRDFWVPGLRRMLVASVLCHACWCTGNGQQTVTALRHSCCWRHAGAPVPLSGHERAGALRSSVACTQARNQGSPSKPLTRPRTAG